MRFDAYAGNVRGQVCAAEVSEAVARSSDARAERGRPRGRYTDCFDIKDGALPVGWVGLDQQLDAVYFEFKGSRTPETSAAVRKWWPDDHSVSRFDSCDDWDQLGAFGRLVSLMDAAKDPRVQSKAITPRDGDRGETIYWGSPTSRVMVRVYEKGKTKECLQHARPNWARAEAQIRPGKAAEKALAARLSPVQAWGFAGWSRRAAESLCGVEVERYAAPADLPTFDGTTLYLARTFRRHLEQMRLDFGDWECVGRELQAVWLADDDAKASTQAALARRSAEGAS